MFVDGAWRITVVGKDADFDQRAVVRTPYGTLVLAGVVGESLVVNADTWQLCLEYLWPGRGWRPDAEVTPGARYHHGRAAQPRGPGDGLLLAGAPAAGRAAQPRPATGCARHRGSGRARGDTDDRTGRDAADPDELRPGVRGRTGWGGGRVLVIG